MEQKVSEMAQRLGARPQRRGFKRATIDCRHGYADRNERCSPTTAVESRSLMANLEDRPNAGKHRLERHPQRVAKLADRNVDRDGENRLDDLRLGVMRVQAIP